MVFVSHTWDIPLAPLSPFSHHSAFAHPILGAHRGGCVRRCRGPLRCPSPAKLPSLLPQGLHTSKEWKKDPSVHWDDWRGHVTGYPVQH